MAWWQSGHAAACKAVYAGSIPTQASIFATICNAGIAQLVEHDLAKVGVASSSLVSRSIRKDPALRGLFFCARRAIFPPAARSRMLAPAQFAWNRQTRWIRDRCRHVPAPLLPVPWNAIGDKQVAGRVDLIGSEF
jgi:hypothetical protein